MEAAIIEKKMIRMIAITMKIMPKRLFFIWVNYFIWASTVTTFIKLMLQPPDMTNHIT